MGPFFLVSRPDLFRTSGDCMSVKGRQSSIVGLIIVWFSASCG